MDNKKCELLTPEEIEGLMKEANALYKRICDAAHAHKKEKGAPGDKDSILSTEHLKLCARINEAIEECGAWDDDEGLWYAYWVGDLDDDLDTILNPDVKRDPGYYAYVLEQVTRKIDFNDKGCVITHIKYLLSIESLESLVVALDNLRDFILPSPSDDGENPSPSDDGEEVDAISDFCENLEYARELVLDLCA